MLLSVQILRGLFKKRPAPSESVLRSLFACLARPSLVWSRPGRTDVGRACLGTSERQLRALFFKGRVSSGSGNFHASSSLTWPCLT